MRFTRYLPMLRFRAGSPSRSNGPAGFRVLLLPRPRTIDLRQALLWLPVPYQSLGSIVGAPDVAYFIIAKTMRRPAGSLARGAPRSRWAQAASSVKRKLIILFIPHTMCVAYTPVPTCIMLRLNGTGAVVWGTASPCISLALCDALERPNRRSDSNGKVDIHQHG